MLHTLWSIKGGSGVTVLAAALGALLAERDGRAVVVDLCGDQPAAMGLAEPAGPGLTDWLATADGDERSLARLLVPIDDRLSLLPRGHRREWPQERVVELPAALAALGCPVIADAGLADSGRDPHDRLVEQLRDAGGSLLVTRPCYLGLRRAFGSDAPVDGVVLVRDVGRSLDRADVQAVLRLPVLATVDCDPAIARAVDAGLLVRRLPRRLARSLGGLLPLDEAAA
jgi:hypothetical protein